MSKINFDNGLPELTRNEKYALWKMRSGKTGDELAKLCGVSAPFFSNMIRSETMPVWHHQTLIAAGVPEDCLPSPEINKKGPKPEGFAFQEQEPQPAGETAEAAS
ncbi:MAG: hypothetical protein FWG17_02940 [Desulfovibrionaceae bacterium]|nr:hypothetical protein [Desulfovibrionaceae bacterium]